MSWAKLSDFQKKLSWAELRAFAGKLSCRLARLSQKIISALSAFWIFKIWILNNFKFYRDLLHATYSGIVYNYKFNAESFDPSSSCHVSRPALPENVAMDARFDVSNFLLEKENRNSKELFKNMSQKKLENEENCVGIYLRAAGRARNDLRNTFYFERSSTWMNLLEFTFSESLPINPGVFNDQ